MRRTWSFSAVLALALLVALFDATAMTAQEDHTHDACQDQLKKLEERVAQLERLIARVAPAEADTLSAAVPQTGRAAPSRSQGFQPPPELVPEVGKIGAEVGLLIGSSMNPFQLNRGSFTGGFIDLPLF